MSDCNNNCEAVSGLNEAAANLIQYRNLINSWLNGSQNQTVNVGGTNIPTLTGLAMSIKQLVGVYPDEQTITIGSDKKIRVKLKANGGINYDANGLYIPLGNGLSIENGALVMDLSNMPTDVFEEMIETFRKGLHVQIRLENDLNLYVDKNNAAASDTKYKEDESWGRSWAKPFASINGCIKYVCDEFNIANFTVTINVGAGWHGMEAGPYNENIILGKFTVTTGKIIIKGTTNLATELWGYVYANNAGPLTFDHIVFTNLATNGYLSINPYFITLENSSNLTLTNCRMSLDRDITSTNPMQCIRVFSGSSLVINGGGPNDKGFLLFYNGFAGGLGSFYYIDHGQVSQNCNCGIINTPSTIKPTFITGFAQLTNISVFTLNRSPIWTNDEGSFWPSWTGAAVGKRYSCYTNSVINTHYQGSNYFPGDTEGTLSTGAQYV